MRKSRFTEQQIVVILKQAEAGVPIQDLVRKHGISEQTFYRWREKYGGLHASEVQELKQLRDENRRLKGLVADLTLDKQVLQEVLEKRSLKPGVQREIVDSVRAEYGLSARSVCRLLGCPRSICYYSRWKDLWTVLRIELRELAATQTRFGYRRLHLLLK